ncbi:lysophospholipase L1-like esterase [Arcicella aurantiaca]|uniref:Lysophospholipase L1-like esterase n=1 Tax=Arcicella aurantiaca TaxID=591202 RepID=A0A316DEI6_9BACT|nr:GDSL-type esterase/lipase family protein [Arcicella aurantiaca]PWK16621.1 lysophospholipase L1-like esterase [Arcicella aurantiaca]
MNKLALFIFINLSLVIKLYAQKPIAWDNTTESTWNTSFGQVEIPSSLDGKVQKAYLYASRSKSPKPLIISLHTWSGDYTQKDPLTDEILARDWNYIHPDFRGANKTSEAGGSKFVISDIEDAIQYALKHTNASPEDVHIIGVSGGGFATLSAYMNIRYPVKSFSAWAPITDLEAWYWESLGRQQKYAKDIVKIVSQDSTFNKKEAWLRSPLHQSFPKKLRENAQLYIYEGIHDGYTGSVPITHSMNMYNYLVGALKFGIQEFAMVNNWQNTDSSFVSSSEIIDLVTKRTNPNRDNNNLLFGRDIHLSKKYQNIKLTIFEGGHEQIPQALALIPYKNEHLENYNILTLGDSNGFNKDGWVEQLKKILPNALITNISKSGRTIGFDNNGKKELNALANIDMFLDEASEKISKKHYDFIVVCIGTNDTKSEYANRQQEVIDNFKQLFQKLKAHSLYKNHKPRIIYMTPPPIRTQQIEAKYQGGNDRIAQLIPSFSKLASSMGVEVVDIYHPLLKVLDYYAKDGVHMAAAGQEIIASLLVEKMNEK